MLNELILKFIMMLTTIYCIGCIYFYLIMLVFCQVDEIWAILEILAFFH